MEHDVSPRPFRLGARAHNPKGPAARWAASRPDRGGSRDRRFNKRELSVRTALRRIRQNSPAPPQPRRGEPLWFAAFFCAKCGFTVRVGLTCRFGRCWTRPTGAQHRSSPRKVTLGSAARLQARSRRSGLLPTFCGFSHFSATRNRQGPTPCLFLFLLTFAA